MFKRLKIAVVQMSLIPFSESLNCGRNILGIVRKNGRGLNFVFTVKAKYWFKIKRYLIEVNMLPRVAFGLCKHKILMIKYFKADRIGYSDCYNLGFR